MGKILNTLAGKLTLARDLSPEGREINYKGRIRQAMGVVSQNMTKLVLLNIFLVIACVPMIVLFGYYMQVQENAILAEMNFSSGIGIGYGIVDNTPEATAAIYDFRLKLFGASLIPCLLLVGLFASGVYYCCRNMLWGAQVKIWKHFFRGIKMHWYKFLLSFAWLGILATGFTCSLIMILKNTAIYGAANAGWWVLTIFIGIVALLSAMYMLIGQGMYVCYRFKMKDYIKNTSILVMVLVVPTLFVTAVFAGFIALSFVSLIGMFMLIYMALLGVSVYVVLNIAYSQYVCDNMIGYLYQEDVKAKQKEQERLARERNQAKKKQAQQQISKNRKSSKKKKKNGTYSKN